MKDWKLYLLIFFNLLNFIVLFITATYKISDNRKKFKNWLNNKGYIVLVCGIITIAIQIIQFKISENEQEELKKENSKALLKQDSIAQIRADSTVAKVVSSFADGFAKYGLKYDTAKQEFEKLIRDSARKTIITANPPNLSICISEEAFQLLEKVDKKYKFRLFLCNEQASAKNIQYKIFALTISETNDTNVISKPIILEKGGMGDLASPARVYLDFFIKPEKDIKELMLHFTAKYEDVHKKPWRTDQIVGIELPSKRVFTPMGKKRTLIQELFRAAK